MVDVTFSSETLDAHNVVIDIGKAKSVTKSILDQLNYKNLDELFEGHLTTTEFVAKYIHDCVKSDTADFFNGKIAVTLGETHDAWASYSG